MKTELVVNHIVNWLKSYADNAGIKGFVVGVSGGIDSATTSTFNQLPHLQYSNSNTNPQVILLIPSLTLLNQYFNHPSKKLHLFTTQVAANHSSFIS